MSKGLGPIQRRVLEVLSELPANEGLPVTELKARVVGSDRSNARRALRTLALRSLVEEVTVEGERRVRLTFWGVMKAKTPVLEKPKPRIKLHARWKAEAKARAQERERRARLEEEAEDGPLWVHYERRRPVRRRRPGPTQQQILAVLWEYADPVDEGLPLRALKAMVGGDRSNVRRAIRTLLLGGEIEQAEDGDRIRLSSGTAFLFGMFPPAAPEPIDEERAKAILRAHRAPPGCRLSQLPHESERISE